MAIQAKLLDIASALWILKIQEQKSSLHLMLRIIGVIRLKIKREAYIQINEHKQYREICGVIY